MTSRSKRDLLFKACRCPCVKIRKLCFAGSIRLTTFVTYLDRWPVATTLHVGVASSSVRFFPRALWTAAAPRLRRCVRAHTALAALRSRDLSLVLLPPVVIITLSIVYNTTSPPANHLLSPNTHYQLDKNFISMQHSTVRVDVTA